MAREKRELNPVERLLSNWVQEAEGQGMIPDFDPEMSASFPNLWALLTWKEIGQYSKQPGTITFQVDGTGWRVSYRDPSAKRSLAVKATTLMEGLRKLDQEVVKEDAAWTGGNNRNRTFRKKKE